MDILQNKFAEDPASSMSEPLLVEGQSSASSASPNSDGASSANQQSEPLEQIGSNTSASSASSASAVAMPLSTVRQFAYLLVAYLAFRLPWIFMLPMTEAPDEFAHFWVIKFLREHWRLPHANEVAAGGASSVYGSMPQLGYIPHVLACTFADAGHFALCERFGSTLMGAVMLFAAYKCGQILFAKNRLCALALPAAIVCHPQLIFIQSYANNDTTSSALSSLLIWLMLATVSRGLNFGRTVWMGALVGWIAITKYSGLAIIPVLGLAMIASIFIHGTSIALALSSIVCAGVLAAALSVWWFVQNAQQYPGDFMGTHTMYKSWAETFHREMHYYLPPSHIIKSLRWWRMTFFSYWGLFGYMNKYLWRPVYIAYVGLVLAAVLGGVGRGAILIVNGIKAWRLGKLSSPSKAALADSLMWGSLALTIVVNIASMIWASVYNYGGPQGRYLITSEIPIMALIVAGLSLLGKRLGNGVVVLFLLFSAAVSIYSWLYLFHLYNGWHFDPLH